MPAKTRTDSTAKEPLERRAFIVRGIVQGVGFRPFVHRTALDLGLSGFVRNQTGEVYLEVEGASENVVRFEEILTRDTPPFARIESIESHPIALMGATEFQILASVRGDASRQVFVSPDLATCDDCLRDLFNPLDRRFRYPFVNCANCGPRLTIIQSAPYDRQRTTMAAFAMCEACRREYDDQTDRRFHAQPIACPACGPQIKLLTNAGQPIETTDPIREFAAAILKGQIGALKGLGGYHLVCDARDESAVCTLRQRKHRDEKPFALMVRTADDARQYCHVDAAESLLLQSSRRPIVLLRAREDGAITSIAQAVAPETMELGIMLPYTPLHHLLMDAVGSHVLVMTSGNRADEPIAYDDVEALERLKPLVDLVLTHNRPIHVRCDDSVARSVSGGETLLRRSRGYAPEPLSLPMELMTATLAVGGQHKSTFALGRSDRAFLSHHLGDLDHLSAYDAFERDIRLYEDLFEIRPQRIVHDLHPDYASTTYARRRAEEQGLRLLAVQHHHAHVASGMAEHRLTGPVIGVAFDGAGYGTDGTIWGGEFLIADYRGFERVAHLRPLGLPGGDAAAREPWRVAISHLIDAECDCASVAAQVGSEATRTVQQMLRRQFNTPLTSSMGRLFDAVAAITGIRTHVSDEGQAAVELEMHARRASPDTFYPFELTHDSDSSGRSCIRIDTRPLIRGIIHDCSGLVTREVIARRFHSTVLQMLRVVCRQLRSETGLNQIVLSGGVFMNTLLSNGAAQQLSADGFRVYRQALIPCNDGGISLGQLAIAAAEDCSR